jgi:hypothetical protein
MNQEHGVSPKQLKQFRQRHYGENLTGAELGWQQES